MKFTIPDHLQNYTWRPLQEDDGKRIAEGLQRAGLAVDTQNPTGALRLYEKLGIEEIIELVETHLPHIDTTPTRNLFTMQLCK